MVPTDRQLVDSLFETIRATSNFIELIVIDAKEHASRYQVVNLAHIQALEKARKKFEVMALIVQFLLTVPHHNPDSNHE